MDIDLRLEKLQNFAKHKEPSMALNIQKLQEARLAVTYSRVERQPIDVRRAVLMILVFYAADATTPQTILVIWYTSVYHQATVVAVIAAILKPGVYL